MNQKIIIALLIVILSSCGESSNIQDKTSSDSKSTQNDGVETPKVSYNQETSPKWVVEQIFEAARSGDFSLINNLCDPAGVLDEKAERLCAVPTYSEEDQNGFAEFFKTGKIYGEPFISGDKARVQIKLGYDGNAEEALNLIKKDGKWYLSSF